MPHQKRRVHPRLTLACGSPLLLLLATGLPAAAEDNRSFDVTPYLWVAGIAAETSPATVPPGTPFDAARFDTRTSAGLMLAAQAHYRSVGVFADFAWLQLDSDAASPDLAFSSGNGKSDFIHSPLGVDLRFNFDRRNPTTMNHQLHQT